MTPIMWSDQTTITGTSESAFWPVNPWSSMVAYQVQPGQGYRFEEEGLMSTASSSPGTLTITPRWGTTTAGTSMGASAAASLTANISNAPWTMRGKLLFRGGG